MITSVPPVKPVTDADLEAPRNDLALTMQLLNKVLDNPPEGVTPAELEQIRMQRANRMRDAANRLADLIIGRRTR